MKLYSHFIKPVILFSLAGMIFSSCSEDEAVTAPSSAPAQSKVIKDKETKGNIDELVKRLPPIGVYNKAMDKYIIFDPYSDDLSKDFSFADPNPGWNFSSSNGVTFVSAPEGGGVLFIDYTAFGSNSGGGSGTVVAGNSTLNINYTFCFSASEQALGLDLFDIGTDFTGVSAVIGIAGDFEALSSNEIDEDAEFTDYFQGLAYYIVYDNEASGSYDVLDWFVDLEEEDSYLEGNAFSYVLAFSEPAGFYFSSEGTLNVSGGSISFNGSYFGITFESLFPADNEDDEDFFEMEYVEVEGFGTMGCN